MLLVQQCWAFGELTQTTDLRPLRTTSTSRARGPNNLYCCWDAVRHAGGHKKGGGGGERLSGVI